jgi:hypothetical protein
MKQDEIPQDHITTFGGAKKAVYALDSTGHYTTTESSGWAVEETATLQAIAEYERLTQEARERYERGEESELGWRMHAARLDIATLSQITGIWQWRIRRHLKPAVFARLTPAIKQRYAEAMGLEPDHFDSSKKSEA